MPKKSAAQVKPNNYELLGIRISREINNPAAQTARHVHIARMPEESPEDWHRLIDEIAENDNVTVSKQDDGSVHLTWKTPTEY